MNNEITPFEKSREERIAEFLKDTLKDEPEEFRNRLIKALASLDTDGIKKVADIISEFAKKNKGEDESKD